MKNSSIFLGLGLVVFAGCGKVNNTRGVLPPVETVQTDTKKEEELEKMYAASALIQAQIDLLNKNQALSDSKIEQMIRIINDISSWNRNLHTEIIILKNQLSKLQAEVNTNIPKKEEIDQICDSFKAIQKQIDEQKQETQKQIDEQKREQQVENGEKEKEASL